MTHLATRIAPLLISVTLAACATDEDLTGQVLHLSDGDGDGLWESTGCGGADPADVCRRFAPAKPVPAACQWLEVVADTADAADTADIAPCCHDSADIACVAGEYKCWDDNDCPKHQHCELPPYGSPLPHPGTCVDDCAPVTCDIYCPFGYVQDKDGCDTCECAPDPCSTRTDAQTCTEDGACVWYQSDQPCILDDTDDAIAACVDGWCVSP